MYIFLGESWEKCGCNSTEHLRPLIFGKPHSKGKIAEQYFCQAKRKTRTTTDTCHHKTHLIYCDSYVKVEHSIVTTQQNYEIYYHNTIYTVYHIILNDLKTNYVGWLFIQIILCFVYNSVLVSLKLYITRLKTISS